MHGLSPFAQRTHRGRFLTARQEDVLDGHRHAVQRAPRPPRHPVQGPSPREHGFGVVVCPRVHLRVALLVPLHQRARALLDRNPPVAHRIARLPRREQAQVSVAHRHRLRSHVVILRHRMPRDDQVQSGAAMCVHQMATMTEVLKTGISTAGGGRAFVGRGGDEVGRGRVGLGAVDPQCGAKRGAPHFVSAVGGPSLGAAVPCRGTPGDAKPVPADSSTLIKAPIETM